jgi:hypothetical protein
MKDDEWFCNWIALNYPEDYKKLRTAWILAGKPEIN